MASDKHKEEDEQEVKIKLSKGDLEKVFNALSKKYSPGYVDRKYMPRAYYDTPKLEMNDAGISARIQYKPGKGKELGSYEQTVKFDITDDTSSERAKGSMLRREIKDKMPDHEPDLSIVTEKKAAALLQPFVNKKLVHVFTAAIERRYFEIEAGKGKKKGTVEVAFDVGEIILPHDGTHHPIYEIELERKGGSAAAIDKLTEEIMEIADSAEIQTLSKSQQGSQFYRNSRKPHRPAA